MSVVRSLDIEVSLVEHPSGVIGLRPLYLATAPWCLEGVIGFSFEDVYHQIVSMR